MQSIMIAGVIGGAGELRRTQNGDAVLGFRVSVSNGKDNDGNWRDSSWYDCSLWGKRAESLQDAFHKGRYVTITGRPSARAYEGKAYMQVSVDQVTFQGIGKNSGAPKIEPVRGMEQGPPDVEEEIPF